ncbi:hypothetical protein PILCRDRAFT_830253, partial [Piloderma croceum F 1598]
MGNRAAMRRQIMVPIIQGRDCNCNEVMEMRVHVMRKLHRGFREVLRHFRIWARLETFRWKEIVNTSELPDLQFPLALIIPLVNFHFPM